MIAKNKVIDCSGINLAKTKMLKEEETESEAQHDDSAESESEVERMPDYFSTAENFIKNIKSRVERDIEEMIAKKMAK